MVNLIFFLQNCVLFWRKNAIFVLDSYGGGGSYAYLMEIFKISFSTYQGLLRTVLSQEDPGQGGVLAYVPGHHQLHQPVHLHISTDTFSFIYLVVDGHWALFD